MTLSVEALSNLENFTDESGSLLKRVFVHLVHLLYAEEAAMPQPARRRRECVYEITNIHLEERIGPTHLTFNISGR